MGCVEVPKSIRGEAEGGGGGGFEHVAAGEGVEEAGDEGAGAGGPGCFGGGCGCVCGEEVGG